jgi:hypothetical protein
MVSLFSVLSQESWCLIVGDLMMGHGWLIGFCVCILWVFCRFVFLGFPRGGIHRWLLFVVWFLVLAVVLSRLLLEERDVLSLWVCFF